MKEFIRRNICLIATILSSLALEGYGQLLSESGFAAPQEGVGSNIALAALTLREGVFPWNMEENVPPVMAEAGEEPAAESEPQTDAAAISETEIAGDPAAAVIETAAEETPAETAVPEAAAEVAAEAAATAFTTVTEDYFSDAVFIGDSRIVGVCEYAGIPNATYYAKTSMTIYKMLNSRVETNKDVRTVREGLQTHKFRKVYLMVGLNEVGVGNTEYFINNYRDVVREIQEMQPDALIYIQGIMHVSARLDRKDNVFSNETINRRNDALAALAEEMGAVYLDINEVYDDENGNLPASYTADDVHLKANHYDLWHDFYLTHAVEVPALPAEEGE